MIPRRVAIGAGIGWAFSWGSPWSKDADTVLAVYKLPDCGCCRTWIRYMEAAGFRLEVTDLPDATARSALQDKLKIPQHLRGCHTSTIGEYVLEGHVSAEQVRQLLDQQPAWRGIYVAGMPRGAPGMEGGAPEPYDVIALRLDGEEVVLAHFGSTTEIKVRPP